MPPPDPPLPPNGLLRLMTQTLEQPPTDTRTGDPTPPPPPPPPPPKIPLQTLISTTLNPVKPSPLMTPPLSTSWIPILPHTLSIKPISTMCLNTLLLTMGLLLIGEPMVWPCWI